MKGSIDIATLVIVMVPMSIFLIIGGQKLSKAAIDTELSSSFEIGKDQFKAQNKLYHVLKYKPTSSDEPLYKKITKYPSSDNQNTLKNTIEERAHEVLNADTSTYYEVVIKYPDGETIKATTWENPSNSWMTYLPNPNTRRVGAINLPSAKKGTITVTVRVLA